MSDKIYELRTLVQDITKDYIRSCEKQSTVKTNYYHDIIHEVEIAIILATLEEMKGNQSKSTVILGINRTTIRNKLKKHYALESSFKEL